jgi:hypothetical protein
MPTRFSAWVIIDDHVRTLRDYDLAEEERRHRLDVWLLYLGLPLVTSLALLAFGLHLNESIVGILVTSMSIFAALLFNLLMIVYDIIRKSGSDSSPAAADADGLRRSNLRKLYLREIYANISFAVLTTVVIVALLLTWLVVSSRISQIWRIVLSLPIYFLIGLFLMTFFMVLKRVHILLREAID